MKSRISTADLFAKAQVGLGATHPCGSDCYAYYICYVDPNTKTIGLYSPKCWFKRDWTDGNMEVEPYHENTMPTKYLQAFRGSWYELDSKMGLRQHKFSIRIGNAIAYQDPSF